MSVESTTPGDGEADVERDVSVEVSFSAAIDEESVDDESFKVVGPAGPVAGELSVDGTTVTFVPSAAWSLLTEYSVEVSTALTSQGGSNLEASYSSAFWIRDGRLRKPERLSSAEAINLNVKATKAGHVVAYWAIGDAPRKSAAVFFDPISQAWGEPAPIEGNATVDFTSPRVALNERGAAFGFVSDVWNRAEAGAWKMPEMDGGGTGSRACALADDGTAMTTWEAIDGVRKVYAASLSSADVWSQPVILQSEARAHALTRYQAGFLSLHTLEADSGVYSRVFEPDQGWGEARRVTPPGLTANYWSLSTDGPSALFTWWASNGRMAASLFDGDTWTTTELGPTDGGTAGSVGSAGHLAAWVCIKPAPMPRVTT